MTRKLHTLIVLATALVCLQGCKKKDDNPSPSLTGKPFYCKIDGTDFIPAGGGRYHALNGGGLTGFQIVGDTTFTTLELYTPSVAVGTYDLNHTSTNDFAGVYINAGSKAYVSTSGELKITKSDGTKISGTFHYTATGSSGTVNVTDGEFNDIPNK